MADDETKILQVLENEIVGLVAGERRAIARLITFLAKAEAMKLPLKGPRGK